ncbi:ATP-binding protein [Thalassococcus sp. S3]|uniref:hybrid sensor histidine kinase/response regulator n=1 Tax=Thalassococcus sp. S3 TaxID=2017482 RepID=UPI0010247F16|nr:ATP-binding protein [Thalassococcus sp. S3]QBF30834.1 hybrid sensor histidine kinase/response regulator [Thalassococcus sp. S3]
MGLIVLGLLAETIFLSRSVVDQLQRLSIATSDNVQWNLAQVEVDFLRFQTAIDQAEREGAPILADLRTRFDILYSRHSIIADSPIYGELRAAPENEERLRSFRAFLDRAIPDMDGPDAGLLAALPQLRQDSLALRPDLRALALDGVKTFAEVEARSRAEVSRTLIKLAFSMLVLIVALLATIAVLYGLFRRGQAVADENQLVRSRFEAMVASSLDAILVVDTHGRIIAFNGAAEGVFGYSSEEAVGEQMSDLIVPEHLRDAHNHGMARYIETGEKRVIDAGRVRLEALHKSGRVFPVELSISAAENEDRTVFVSFLRDISQQVADEEELVRARDEAQAGEKAKSELLSVMSHEMRTPLNGILGSLELIDRENLTGQQVRYLDAIRVSGNLLLSHVNDVLDLSRINAMSVRAEEVEFALDETVRNLVDSHMALTKAHGNEMHVHLNSDTLSWVRGDELRLKQCLLNLIGNANKFTADGVVTVEVERLDDGEVVEFRISDTGIGISEDDIGKIFDDFVMIDTAYSRGSSGTGLGLAITRRLVTAMGGEIEADSIEGEGSLFTMRLPLPVVQRSKSISAQPSRSDLEESQNQPLTLVVDDNDINRMIAADMLTQAGHRVEEADGGKAAILAARKTRYDLILMDISMPEVDGIEALQTIRAENGASAETLIVALTAHAATEDQDRIRRAGFDDLLIKPLSRRAVTTVLPLHLVDNQEEDGKQDAISILGPAKYAEALADFHEEAARFLTRLEKPGGRTSDLQAEAHELWGSASVLGVSSAWRHLQMLERADAEVWDSARKQAIGAFRENLSEVS